LEARCRSAEDDESVIADEPRILILDRLTSSCLEQTRTLSAGGLLRVVGVAAPQSALSSKDAFALRRAGASDLIVLDDVKVVAAEIIARHARWIAIDEIIRQPVVQQNLIGTSRSWISVLRQVVQAARFANLDMLITGENGTGKELLARLIHTLDGRSDKGDLVVLDCTTIVPELAGSEFFGHERGAFTGAATARDGAFALADRGTLFLDEVGELPRALQSQLLRVIQEHTYKRVGGNTWHKTAFRLVCATNRNLVEEVHRGTFRADLYYRLAGWSCWIPPLRERPDDIQALAVHFMRQVCDGANPPPLSAAVRDYLMSRDYPGNIRELRQVVARMLHHHVGSGPITVGDVAASDWPVSPVAGEADSDGEAWDPVVRRELARGAGLKEIGRHAEEAALRLVVQEEGGNLQRAAQRLQVSDRALQMRRAAGRLPSPLPPIPDPP
jgi:transcriptional regulator with GAF, ATPase, and Fis domain